MDPVPVSSPWFLSRMFQSLVPTVLGFSYFKLTHVKLVICTLNSNSEKRNSAKFITTNSLFPVNDLFLNLLPYTRSTD